LILKKFVTCIKSIPYQEITQADDNELNDLFWGNPPDKEKLDFTLQEIIGKIEKIPIEK